MVFAIGTVVFVMMTFLSGQYSRLFVQRGEIREMVQTGMVIFMVSFFFSGINAITSFYFTSIGKALESAVISMSRGLVVLLACIFVLPAWFGMTGVWLAAPVTEAVTICISWWMVCRVVSRRIIETNRHGIFTRDMEAIHIFHIPRLFRPVEV